MKKTNIVQYLFYIIISISVIYNYDIRSWFKNNRLVNYEHFLTKEKTATLYWASTLCGEAIKPINIDNSLLTS